MGNLASIVYDKNCILRSKDQFQITKAHFHNSFCLLFTLFFEHIHLVHALLMYVIKKFLSSMCLVHRIPAQAKAFRIRKDL